MRVPPLCVNVPKRREGAPFFPACPALMTTTQKKNAAFSSPQKTGTANKRLGLSLSPPAASCFSIVVLCAGTSVSFLPCVRQHHLFFACRPPSPPKRHNVRYPTQNNTPKLMLCALRHLDVQMRTRHHHLLLLLLSSLSLSRSCALSLSLCRRTCRAHHIYCPLAADSTETSPPQRSCCCCCCNSGGALSLAQHTPEYTHTHRL